jgi:N-acetylglutamate synthase-like GNAT family acetyltransferase
MADGELMVTAAAPADAAGVIALIGRVFAEYGFAYDPAVEVADLLRFRAHYERPRGAFFVARRGGLIVGSVGVERLEANTAELHRLYLDAELRGRRLGRALVEVVLDWCRAQDIPRIILWSDTRFDRAHRLYARMGFVQTGERELPHDVNGSREYGFARMV